MPRISLSRASRRGPARTGVAVAAVALAAMALVPSATAANSARAEGAGAAAVMSPVAAARSAAHPGRATRASAAAAAKLRLTVHRVPDPSQKKMDATFANSSIHTIVNSAVNHHLHRSSTSACTADERAARPTYPSVPTNSVYCWDKGDATTQHWSPQGLTSSGDSDGDGMWGTDRVLVSGWGSANQSAKLGRLALINADVDSTHYLGYRWALPVIPINGGTDFRPLKSHMGGMVWWGDKLLVTGSLGGTNEHKHHNAIYVFSTKHIYRANTSASWTGKRGSQVSAHGYQYFWPAIGSYSVGDDHCSATSADTRTPCFDGLALDRSSNPYTLVANEFVTTNPKHYRTARVWRYKLAPTSRLMPIAVNSAGHADPMDVYDTGIVGMQGTFSRTENGERVLYTADSVAGPKVAGVPWREPLPGAGQRTAAHDPTSAHGSTTGARTWAQHSEGMTYMPDQQRVWSQTEWAADSNGDWPTDHPVRERVLFTVPLSSLRGALTP
ncbi:hypothetical protein [Streptomyces beihaiensis]|uniref:Secreted protein n=1 Tax=Streptomyces beihaiensis TaxID=2984495 RepID=A0ABT3TZ14_9ACTN|nr:hypothetical protein [Streptomyces beihaiensis]MCX3061711.1 hypothetical protein [Streptomyces beihaiensis]